MTPGADGDLAALSAQLTAVLVALWYEIDHNGGSRASAFFTPDAQLRLSDAVFRGTAEIDQVYASRSARGPRVSRHIVANLHVLEAGEAWARVTSVLLLFAQDGEPPRPLTSPALVGDVIDELELHQGRWLIRSRWIQNLFIEPATELAVPQTRRAIDE